MWYPTTNHTAPHLRKPQSWRSPSWEPKFHKIWNDRYSEELLPHINSGSVNLIVALTWPAFMATTLVLLMGWSRKVRTTLLQTLAVRLSFQTQKTISSYKMRQTIADITMTPQS